MCQNQDALMNECSPKKYLRGQSRVSVVDGDCGGDGDNAVGGGGNIGEGGGGTNER